MPRMIEYWLVREIHTGWYARLTSDGTIAETSNPKLAWRFFDKEGASQIANRLGNWDWQAIKMQFPGDEPVVI